MQTHLIGRVNNQGKFKVSELTPEAKANLKQFQKWYQKVANKKARKLLIELAETYGIVIENVWHNDRIIKEIYQRKVFQGHNG